MKHSSANTLAARPARAAPRCASAAAAPGGGRCASPGNRTAAGRCACRRRHRPPADRSAADRAAASAAPRASACCRRCWAAAHASPTRSPWSSPAAFPASSSAARAVTCIAGAERLEAELLLAPPLHADAMIGDFARDHRRIHRDVVGAVMAVAAGAMRMPHGDRCPAACPARWPALSRSG